MPIAHMLDFARHGLTVEYRASIEPQVVTIDIAGAGASDEPMGPVAMSIVEDCVSFGGGGGADFPPSAGRWVVLAGPEPLSDAARGPTFHFEVQAQGVCPVFMRSAIEHLRTVCSPHLLTAMSIRGALPVDETPLSVTTRQMLAWLDDPSVYPGPWHHIPFAFATKTIPRGAALRAEVAADIDEAIFEQFQMTMICASNAVADYPAQNGDGLGVIDTVPKMGRGKRELFARWPVFTHVRPPTIHMFTNMLIRFHADVAPLTRVELDLA